jgi:hypothetical protein
VRNILLLLLLANILVLFWYNWVEIPPRRPQVAEQAAADLPVRGPEAPVDEMKPLLAEPPVCFLSEVQASREEAEMLAAQFAGESLVASLIEEKQQVAVDYWVRIDGFSDSSAAQAAVENLHAAGFLDSYVMRDEDIDSVWFVSLGIYRNQAGAESMVADATERGFAAVLRPRLEVSPVYRLQLIGNRSDVRTAASAAQLMGSYIACDIMSSE